MFAKFIILGTRKRRDLSSATLDKPRHSAHVVFAECLTLGKARHLAYRNFAENLALGKPRYKTSTDAEHLHYSLTSAKR